MLSVNNQDNYNAELQAILVALRGVGPIQGVIPADPDEPIKDPGVLIVTDSESSIKAITSFREKSFSEQHKTVYRHVIREILSKVDDLENREIPVPVYQLMFLRILQIRNILAKRSSQERTSLKISSLHKSRRCLYRVTSKRT